MKPRQSSTTPRFWNIFVFIFFYALGLCLLLFGRPSERLTAWIWIGLFGSMTLLTTLWEVGRHRQGPGVEWRLIQVEGVERKVWFFPASRLHQLLFIATLLSMSVVFSSIITFFMPSFQTFDVVSFGCVALAVIFFTLTRTRGIALLPSGVLWIKEDVPLHIPWDTIEAIAITCVTRDAGHGIKTQVPALGLRLRPAFLNQISDVPPTGRCPMSSTTHAKLISSRKESTFDLTYFEESLIIPGNEAIRLLNFFRENPRHRRELHPEETQLGFLESLLHSKNI